MIYVDGRRIMITSLSDPDVRAGQVEDWFRLNGKLSELTEVCGVQEFSRIRDFTTVW